MAVVKTVDEREVHWRMESVETRLAESEMTLTKVAELADEVYLLLGTGDVEKSRQLIGDLISRISDYFLEEIH